MQEAIQKNFILLSAVAKEKKYAQEYLGLLARRGDIGSIRIGKRWFTTWQWFEEFLENSQQKKKTESACEIKVSQLEERVFEDSASLLDKSARIAIAVKTKKVAMPVRKNVRVGFGDIRAIGASGETRRIRTQPILRDESRLRNVSVAEKNRYAVPYQEIRFKKKAGVFSPDLSSEEKIFAPIFSRFAFVAGFAMMIVLMAASGYFVWSGGLLAKGTVAGASDEKKVVFSVITSGGEHTLARAGDKMKESLSVSRVMVQAAKERGN